MLFCDLHDGRTELRSDLPKRSQVRWESWALYQTPASLLGNVAESKLKEKTLSVFLRCYKGSLTFIFSVKPYYVQTCAVRCCPGAEGELPSGSFVHRAEILKASICWKSQALLLTARYSGLSLKMESLKACLEQEQQMITAAILSSLGVL